MSDRAIRRGGESYYSISAAKDVTNKLLAQGVAVVGIEGFRIDETSTRPLIDYIAHWPNLAREDWDAYVDQCAHYCLQVLGEWEKGDVPDHFMVALATEQNDL